MKKVPAPFFDGIYAIDYVKSDSSGVREARVPCVLEGGTREGYALKYPGPDNEERLTAAKELHRVRPTDGWLDACGFVKDDEGRWVLSVEHEFPGGGGVWRERLVVVPGCDLVMASTPTANVELRGDDKMYVDAIQIAAAVAGMDVVFPFEAVGELER